MRFLLLVLPNNLETWWPKLSQGSNLSSISASTGKEKILGWFVQPQLLMGLEAPPRATVMPVLLDNADPRGWGSSNPARPLPAASVKLARLWFWYRDTMNGLPRARQQPSLHRHHWQDVPGCLLRHSGHGTATIGTIQLPYPYKRCPQANHPVGMIAVLHWLLNKVQRLSGRTFVCHGQKTHEGTPPRNPWGQALRNTSYLTYWYRYSRRECNGWESCEESFHFILCPPSTAKTSSDREKVYRKSDFTLFRLWDHLWWLTSYPFCPCPLPCSLNC